MWRKNHSIRADVVARPHDVDVHPGPEQRVIISGDRSFVRRLRISLLKLQCPDAVVIVNDRDLWLGRSSGQYRRQSSILPRHLSSLVVPPIRFAIVPQQPVPILLPPHRATPPAEPNLAICAVRQLLITNLAKLTGLWITTKRIP